MPTNASINPNFDSPQLPVPKISVQSSTISLSFIDVSINGGLIEGATTTINRNSRNSARIIAYDIPDYLFDPGYDLQLEILRYRRGSGKNSKTKGYVHPSNAINPSGDGRFDRGGVHNDSNNVPILVQAQTEFPVTSHMQVIDVSQACADWMVWEDLAFREAGNTPTLNNSTTVNAIIPREPGRFYSAGRRFGYTPRFYPGRFKFRYSVIDRSDDRGKRISGPLSENLILTSRVFPFIVNPTSNLRGIINMTVNPDYDETCHFYVGGRVPSST